MPYVKNAKQVRITTRLSNALTLNVEKIELINNDRWIFFKPNDHIVSICVNINGNIRVIAKAGKPLKRVFNDIYGESFNIYHSVKSSDVNNLIHFINSVIQLLESQK